MLLSGRNFQNTSAGLFVIYLLAEDSKTESMIERD